MKISFEKSAALLSSGLLAFTLSACGADDDTSPAPEETNEEQFDTFEDEDSGPDQSGSPLDEDGAPGPGTAPGEDPDVAPEEGETDDMGPPQNEETQDDDVGEN